MNITKLNNGHYRARETINGQVVSHNFTHKPTQKELKSVFYRVSVSNDRPFIEYAKDYVSSKENVLSPSTIRGYETLIRSLSDFGTLPFDSVTNEQLQNFINTYSENHSAKSTNNLHGFISSVFRFYAPQRNFYTTLPKRTQFEPYIPSESDVKKIIDYAKENKPEYYVPFVLGCYGLRRGEICCLTDDDVISVNKILIHKTLVQNKDFEWIVKQSPKSKAGFRTVIVPEEVCNYIKTNGYAYIGCPDNLTQMLHRIQKRLSLPNFSFHKLRHFYCCFAHNLGIPDVLISKTVGHEHISTTQNIYIHANKTRVDEIQIEVSDKLSQMIDGTC